MPMEFIDKITASVSKTVKQASDSAKILADKNRVRKEIASVENELRNRYRTVGEQFYAENAASPAPEYAEVFGEIAALQADLAAMQHELEILTGSLTCKFCGRTFGTDASFCPYCGEPVPVEPSPAEATAVGAKTCEVCGAALAADAVFCAVCGHAVPKDEPASDADANANDAPAQNICPNCGTPLQDDAMFCGVCGTKAPGID